MSDQKNITGHDGYILVEALSFTIEALSALPLEFRPDNNIKDMKRILDGLIKQDANLAQSQWHARRKVDQLDGRSDWRRRPSQQGEAVGLEAELERGVLPLPRRGCGPGGHRRMAMGPSTTEVVPVDG